MIPEFTHTSIDEFKYVLLCSPMDPQFVNGGLLFSGAGHMLPRFTQHAGLFLFRQDKWSGS